MSSLVSVIVPVYNVVNYLPQCIDSILNQTFCDIELVLVDDGSTDGSEMLCDQYMNNNDNVVVIHKENEGVVKARLTGLKYAKGQFVMFVDSDDWIEKNMIEKMTFCIEKYDVDVVMCNIANNGNLDSIISPIYEKGKYDKSKIENEIFPNILYAGEFYRFGIIPSVYAKLYCRKYILQVMESIPQNITFAEDLIGTLCIMQMVDSIYILGEALYNYRMNPVGLSKGFNKKQTSSSIEVINYLKTFNKMGKLKQQNYYYHCFLSFGVIANEARGGLSNFVAGYKRILEYCRRTELSETLNSVETKNWPMFRKLEKIMFSNKIGIFMLLLFLSIINIIEN